MGGAGGWADRYYRAAVRRRNLARYAWILAYVECFYPSSFCLLVEWRRVFFRTWWIAPSGRASVARRRISATVWGSTYRPRMWHPAVRRHPACIRDRTRTWSADCWWPSWRRAGNRSNPCYPWAWPYRWRCSRETGSRLHHTISERNRAIWVEKQFSRFFNFYVAMASAWSFSLVKIKTNSQVKGQWAEEVKNRFSTYSLGRWVASRTSFHSCIRWRWIRPVENHLCTCRVPLIRAPFSEQSPFHDGVVLAAIYIELCGRDSRRHHFERTNLKRPE